MAIKVAINGFGRIGRMVFKAGFNDSEVEFVAVNDLTDTETLAHLLKYDSVQGKFDAEVKHTKDSLIINGKELKVLSEKDPKKLPWKNLGIDIVVESTGRFRKKPEIMQHIKAGAKKVLLSAPPKGDEKIKTIVKGVNEHDINDKDIILSNASCTTNCLAPMMKVLNDNFEVVHGFMTTIHAYTADQRLVDAPHKDLRRARTAAVNIIPTSTGAALALGSVIPELNGKMDGIAVRVPVPCGSFTDVSCVINKDATVEEINELFKNVSQHHLKDVLEYSEDLVVSSDIIKNNHSCIFCPDQTKVINKKLVKITGWYDNEWGYSCRMIDIIKLMK